MPEAEQLCLDHGALNVSEQLMPAERSSATDAANGGPSTASGETHVEPAESTTAAETAEPRRVVVDGWELDDSNPCGHKLHRTVRMVTGDTVISLTVGDMDDEECPAVHVPSAVLRWLLTGVRP